MPHTGTTTAIDQLVNGRRRGLWSILVLLIVIVLVFFTIRLVVDIPNLVDGTMPDANAFEHRYVLHPVAAYFHIVPGVVYLLGAPFQLSRRFRTRHLTWHRRMGRILLPTGFVAGVLSLVVGVWFPYGGSTEASAAVVFGLYFSTALVLAFRAIRGGDVTQHRRWMIRAFAVALGVGTIRIWVGLFQLVGLLAIQDNTGTAWFGVAFWLAFILHALAAEAYLVARPVASGKAPTDRTSSAAADDRP
jgi:Predicted membrane protein (DUF2306)